MSKESGVWYEAGLCFTCTRCGNCCSGFSGTVSVNDDEIAALADRLELGVDEFRQQYARVLSDGSISLREKPNYDCVFYDSSQGCTVYEDRPRQCRTWPFWQHVLASPATWENESRDCPGMNRGDHFDLVRIRTLIRSDGVQDGSKETK